MNEGVNIVVETITTLGLLLFPLVGGVMGLVEFVKSKTKITNTAVEVVSLLAGLVSSGLISWVYADSLQYSLVLGQWVGVGFFVVFGTVGPSGGYKLLGFFTGKTASPRI